MFTNRLHRNTIERKTFVQKRIKEELLRLDKIENQINNIIRCGPDEKLRCVNSKGYYQYYAGGKYLGKDKKGYAKQIAQKEYCLKLEKELKEYKKVLQKAYDLYQNRGLDNIYRELYPGRKILFDPLVNPIEDIIDEFEKLEYEGKSFDKENTTEFYSIKGERVRSKSEKIIADELYRYGIPYKYEMPIELENWNKKVLIYPDFTALNCRSGRRWIIEHLGMMDKPTYYESALYKLDTYEKNDILLGHNLILFHETSASPLSINVVRKYIEIYLM